MAVSSCGDAPSGTNRVDHELGALVARCHQAVEVFIISRLSVAMQMAKWQPQDGMSASGCCPVVRLSVRKVNGGGESRS